jgi:cytochrome P450
MGRLEKYWEKPLEFMPERWLDPEKNKERHPYLFIPFQGLVPP